MSARKVAATIEDRLRSEFRMVEQETVDIEDAIDIAKGLVADELQRAAEGDTRLREAVGAIDWDVVPLTGGDRVVGVHVTVAQANAIRAALEGVRQ